MPLTLTSPAYGPGEMIPKKYTCDGENISPPLQWSNVPEGTASFAIIFDDPDAPFKTWVHWIIYNIAGDEDKLDEHIQANGALLGINDFKKRAYRGPCPPVGPHHYVMKLYALDTKLDLQPGVTKEDLLKAMNGHVIEQAELKGQYERPH